MTAESPPVFPVEQQRDTGWNAATERLCAQTFEFFA
jgi:hypothetical protein